jgi:hypothetical protein
LAEFRRLLARVVETGRLHPRHQGSSLLMEGLDSHHKLTKVVLVVVFYLATTNG